MSEALRFLRRFAQASPHELWTRFQQSYFAVRNYSASWGGGSALSRHGHTRSLDIHPNQIGPWWKSRPTSWFVHADRVELLRGYRDVESSGIPWILQRADDVLQDRIPLFSHGPIDYNRPDRWHHDAIHQKTAPAQFHGRVAYLNFDVVGDSKHVWEPNRFAWAVWLGMAYRITGNATYAEKFRQWTLDWFQSNPYPQGINYCSALELAYRNYAWLWSLSLFGEYLKSDDELLGQMLRGIWTGARHIEENLSLYFSPNTHILGEAFSLYAVGAAIPEFNESSRWRSTGLKLLESEGKKQFFQDGMHRELSSGYHIYSTDIYLHAVKIGRETGFEVAADVEQTACRAARRLAELVPHDLMMPQFHDCDGGRLLNLVPCALDAAPSLIAAQALFPEQRFLPVKSAPRGYPLLMWESELQHSRSRHVRRPTAIPVDRDVHEIYDSGLASYRTDAGDFVLLRGSCFGYLECPHSHDAGLGVILYLNRVPVFVDSGVGSYTQSRASRDAFRLAHGKNTILVNGGGPSKPRGWFSWDRTTDSQLVCMQRIRGGFVARAKHAGFSHSPHTHTFVQREIMILDLGTIAIVDRWDSDSDILVESKFTLNPELTLDSARKVLRTDDHQEFHFDCFSLKDGEDIEFVTDDVAYSANYGLHATTKAIAFRHGECCRGGMVTFVSRCGCIERSEDGHVSIEASKVKFELTRGGVILHDTCPVEQFN